MYDYVESYVLTEEQIHEKVVALGKQITEDYKGKTPLFIGLLRGCLPFMSDLVKQVKVDCRLDYMRASSYTGAQSSGIVNIKGEIPEVDGKDVIIVDDILETGRTIEAVKKLLLDQGAKSVEICVLLDKPNARKVDIEAKYVGGEIPNAFVIGYGLDYNGFYRNLPFIGVLKEEIYKK